MIVDFVKCDKDGTGMFYKSPYKLDKIVRYGLFTGDMAWNGDLFSSTQEE